MHHQSFWLKSNEINAANTLNSSIDNLFRFRYLIEIAKIYNIEYEPDPQVMQEENRPVGKYLLRVGLL